MWLTTKRATAKLHRNKSSRVRNLQANYGTPADIWIISMVHEHLAQSSDKQTCPDRSSVQTPQSVSEKGPETFAKPEETLPKVAISWSLDPTTHSFHSPTAPTLRLELTNHDTRPITIYNENFRPGALLAEAQFSIFDNTTNLEVHQSKTIFCNFVPPSYIHVPLPEKSFHTLPPGEPVAFTTRFTLTTEFPPRSKEHRARVRGVDGLEIGHHYSLRPGSWRGFIRWWDYGEKEEVINPPSGKLDGRKVMYRPKKAPHPGFDVEVEKLPEIQFWCVE